MDNKFRSRGIRIIKDNDIVFSEQMKIYYEPDSTIVAENERIHELINNNILMYFEYSQLEDGTIDTYNFHVNLMEKYEELYKGLSAEKIEKLNAIVGLFDESFRNYTVGYRVDNQVITSQSYYFYPTILKETRYGIKGIVDKTVINCEVERFAKYISKENEKTREEIQQFGRLMNKLKGVSVHILDNQFGYKLYGRIEQSLLTEFLKDTMGYELIRNDQYGEVVLIAQRIQNEEVKGYNIYYLS